MKLDERPAMARLVVLALLCSSAVSSLEANDETYRPRPRPIASASTLALASVHRKLQPRTHEMDKGRKRPADPRTVQWKDHRAAGSVSGSVSGSVPRKIIVCGPWYKDGISIFFPKWSETNEHITVPPKANLTMSTMVARYGDFNERDVVFSNIHRAAYCLDQAAVHRFPGKFLLYNTEPEDEWPETPRALDEPFDLDRSVARQYDYLPPHANMLTMGPHQDVPGRSVQVFPLVHFWYKSGLYLEKERLLDPSKKPRSSREHFMAYVSSHFVETREQKVHLVASTFHDRFGLQLHTGGRCQGNAFQSQIPEEVLKEAAEKKTKRQGLRQQRRLHPILNMDCVPWAEDSEGGRAIKPVVMTSSKNYRVSFLENNLEFYSHYRFTLVLENSIRPGYITEKILLAFLSGTVPVYWGTSDIFKVFNPKAFVYIDDENPQAALDQIAELEKNAKAYEAMAKEPILNGGGNGTKIIEDFFSLSNDVGGGALRARILNQLGFDPTEC